MDSTVYMPDGRPAPVLLTEAELIQFLRLDLIEVRFPKQTIQRYRDKGLLRGCQVSKQILYPTSEVMRFIDRQTEEVAR